MSIDILDRGAVCSEIAAIRPGAIYHCAGAAHLGASWDHASRTFEQNVRGTHHVLEAVKLAGLRTRVLIPGSAAVYGASTTPLSEDDPLAPASPYGLSKLAQEMLGRHVALDDGMAVLLTRSFNHIGPRQSPAFVASSLARQLALIEAGRSQPVLEVGNLEARRDLTDVRDTVRGYRTIMEQGRPGVAYNVCSGRAYSIKHLVRELVLLVRIPVKIRVDPSRYRPNDAPLVVGNGLRLQEETGWTPAIPLERTLIDLLAFWRDKVQSSAT